MPGMEGFSLDGSGQLLDHSAGSACSQIKIGSSYITSINLSGVTVGTKL